MSLQIGPYKLKSRLLLAPMAGITDKPYRDICREFGAGLVYSEMISSDLSLINSKKTQARLIQPDEPIPRAVQLLGTDPYIMAEAAQYNVERGANIIDINMGCPAKKVCNKAAGSALMQDEKRVKEILTHVVNSVNVPITLKIRTGLKAKHRNAIKIARIAEDCGISSLVIHGRTRKQAFTGYAEFETIRQTKQQVTIPVIANGDIININDINFILDYTQADGIMLGRITRGQPWIFRLLNDQINEINSSESRLPIDKRCAIFKHIRTIYRHNNSGYGVAIARKHIGWYLSRLGEQNINLLKQHRKMIFSTNDANEQLQMLEKVLNHYLS